LTGFAVNRVEGGLQKDGKMVEDLTRWLEQADPEVAAEDAF